MAMSVAIYLSIIIILVAWSLANTAHQAAVWCGIVSACPSKSLSVPNLGVRGEWRCQLNAVSTDAIQHLSLSLSLSLSQDLISVAALDSTRTSQLHLLLDWPRSTLVCTNVAILAEKASQAARSDWKPLKMTLRHVRQLSHASRLTSRLAF